ncbi:MAG: RsmE family RNA methyltransferase [Bdellovibrionales bacterium]
MNLILVEENQITTPGHATIRCPETIKHVQNVLNKTSGQTINVGMKNGNLGTAKVDLLNDDELLISNFEFTMTPPKALPMKLIVALQRPKMMRRILRTAAMIGIKDIHILHSFKVEKSYWMSDFIEKVQWERSFFEGLSQSRDTIFPRVELHTRFKPFVQDCLPQFLEHGPIVVAHPYTENNLPSKLLGPLTVAIGPEGGWIDYEINLFESIGAKPMCLSRRILRSEDVLSAIGSRHVDF